MILIGQYDSPFVGRVGIALRLYDLPFEHRPWSTFGDGDKVAQYNPLRRVPVLVLDNGETLIESALILDWLDEQQGRPERALVPQQGDARRRALKVCALATGMADKAVALFYEKVLHKEQSVFWADRCRSQIEGALQVLEADRAALATPWWHGAAMGHADIAVACALRFCGDAHPGSIDPARWPALAAHAAACEALPVFKDISQTFIPPSA